MSEIAAISKLPTATPTAVPRAAPARVLSDEVDLYAEANAFSEADWAGPEITDLFGKDGFDFKDIIDTINPLHHLPVVGTVYRALTGDELAPAPRVVGGTLFGGIAGFVTALANTVLENETGRDMGDTVLAQFVGDTPGAAVADAAAPATDVAAKGAAPTPASLPVKKPGPGNETSPSPAAAIKAAFGTSSLAGPGEAENPTTALIQARAAVPASPRSANAATAFTGASSAIALPGGKTLPIQFRSGTSAASSAAAKQDPVQTAVPSQPAAEKQVAAPPGAPRLLRPGTAEPTPVKEAVATAAPEQDREISDKMLDALSKYESLMRARTAPSISSEI